MNQEPLLANIYLHWFDKIFHGSAGPGTWAKAVLVRYADDFVIVARYMTNKIVSWVENNLEGKFGLIINREKTKIVDLDFRKGKLDFLGFTLHKEMVRNAPWIKYCKIQPSKKSIKRAKESIRELTNPSKGYKSIPTIVRDLNRFTQGWGQYFSKGHPSNVFDSVNVYLDERFYHFLQRRSQRGFKKRKENTWYREMRQLGVELLFKHRFT